jgi:hypothetical protein
LAVDLWAFLDELVCLPLIGGEELSWGHFAHQPCGRSVRPYIYLLFGMQKCRFTTPSQDAGIIVLSMGVDGILTHLPFRSPDPTPGFEVRVYTSSHSTSPISVMGFSR